MGIEGERDCNNPTFGCIAVKRRRDTLGALLTWGTPQTERRLAAYLAANKQGTPAIEETTVDTFRAHLVHKHLPALEQAGFITWDRDHQKIDMADHPALNDPRFMRLLELESYELEEVFRALSHDYRRIVLTALRKADSPMSRKTLAREVLRCRVGENEFGSREVDDLAVLLYHNHLPRLADAELIEYNVETGQATYADHPALERVFAIIYDRDGEIAEKAAGFFNELHEAFEKMGQEAGRGAQWPHHWRTPHHD